MKFDTLIIGGGLAGLICAIRLQKKGQRVAVVSAGQSALHFSSGSFDLLSYDTEGNTVTDPTEAVAHLNETHPYRKLGSYFKTYADKAPEFLRKIGINVEGFPTRNHFRYTPMGTLRPTWLTFSEFATTQTDNEYPQGKSLILNFAGFLDFNTQFIAGELKKAGKSCDVKLIEVETVESLRLSPTEMRASNIAKALEYENTFKQVIEQINRLSQGYDHVILPAVFGFKDNLLVKKLKEQVKVDLLLMPTMPPSVPGVRTQMNLRKVFENLGGVFFMGDTIKNGEVTDHKVTCVYSENHADMPISAKNYVLATGHMFSDGIMATNKCFFEPVFNADVDFLEGRENWYSKDVFGKHNYSSFGVATDNEFHVKSNGQNFKNLFAIGSILSGASSLKEGSGAGVSILTALYVADRILEGEKK